MLYFDSNFGKIELVKDFRLSNKIKFEDEVSKHHYYADILHNRGVGILKEKFNEEFKDQLSVYFSRFTFHMFLCIFSLISFFISYSWVILILVGVFGLLSHINFYWMKEYNVYFSLVDFESYIEWYEKIYSGEEEVKNPSLYQKLGNLYIKYRTLWCNRNIVLFLEKFFSKKKEIPTLNMGFLIKKIFN